MPISEDEQIPGLPHRILVSVQVNDYLLASCFHRVSFVQVQGGVGCEDCRPHEFLL
jgi:hypothetical protein